MTGTTSKHWDDIYQRTPKQRLGWYEEDLSQSLQFIKQIRLPAGSHAFVAGAGKSDIVSILSDLNYQMTVNDISSEALTNLKQQHSASSNIKYLLHDLSKPLENQHPIHLWFDRAVLHFLLNENEISQYFANVNQSLASGGYAFFAEFAKGGAEKCAGLPIHQYTAQELSQRLGPDFNLVKSEDVLFVNPNGDPRPYIYALFQKQD